MITKESLEKGREAAMARRPLAEVQAIYTNKDVLKLDAATARRALEFAKDRLRMFLDCRDDVSRLEAQDSLRDIELIERGEEPETYGIKSSS